MGSHGKSSVGEIGVLGVRDTRCIFMWLLGVRGVFNWADRFARRCIILFLGYIRITP